MLSAETLESILQAIVHRLPDGQGTCSLWILREAGKQLLPEHILTRPKVGFRVPVHRWFRGEMREYLLEIWHRQHARA